LTGAAAISLSRWSIAVIVAGVLACGSGGPRGNAASSHPGNCLGADSPVVIAPRGIGALRADFSLDSIRRLCANLQWTTTNGDESLDTAIVITRPGLRVLGVITTVEADGGPYRPVHFDSTTHVELWKISGTAGLLPGRVPITATWGDLRRAYGPLRAFALNGIVYVSACRQPALQFLMTSPSPESPINGASPTAVDSVMAGVPIDAVTVRPNAAASPVDAACSE